MAEGDAGKTATKPEAAYFTETDGMRSEMLIVNAESNSDVPALSEPWFLKFEADSEFKVAMSPVDVQNAGLESLGKKWA